MDLRLETFLKKRMMFWSLICWGFCLVSAETNMHLMMSKRSTRLDNGGQVEDVNKVLFCNCTFFRPTCSIPAVPVHACCPHSAPILCQSPVIFQSYKALVPFHAYQHMRWWVAFFLSQPVPLSACMFGVSRWTPWGIQIPDFKDRILVWMEGRN